MKKPRVALLRRAIHDVQNELRKEERFSHLENPLSGACQDNLLIAKRFEGGAYRTLVGSVHGMDHTVAVVSTRGSRRGQVVDITKEEGIVGIVENIHDEKSVGQTLAHLFGVGGWQRRK